MGRDSLPQLGELERLVLERLWSHGAADVKAMYRGVGEARGIRPNTVQSTLDRLYRKGLAERQKVGRAFCYRARLSRREWLSRSLDALFADLREVDTGLLLSTFVDLAERAGDAQLEALERLVSERRKRDGRGGR